MKREKAVAVGNRAGVVEWANAAWERVTGYALEDAISKPVGDTLAQAGIERDVIDFVAGRFERGEPCEIELPLTPPDSGSRWIHVSIESLRDRHGEVSHFAAIAWDITAEKRAEAESQAVDVAAEPGRQPTLVDPISRDPISPDPIRVGARSSLDLAATDLSTFAREISRVHSTDSPYRTCFDLELPGQLPRIALDPVRVGDAVADILGDALAAIGDEWGTVSLSTGIARSEAVFVSPTYPRNCLLRGIPEGRYVYLEIHDTGLPIDRTVVAAASGATPPPGSDDRLAHLASARMLLEAHGGALRIDADAGFGTRVILLFPS